MSRLEKRKALNERLTKEAQARRRQERRYTAEEVAADRQAMYRSLQSLSSVLDSSGEYRIIAFISTAEELLLKSTSSSSSSSSKYSHHHRVAGDDHLDDTGSQYQHQRRNDVALVTHGTVLQLHHLPLLASRWHGLLSVSVFVVSIQQLPLAVEAILLLRHCSPAIRHRASFHLVYPLNLSAKLSNRQARTVLDFLRWPDILEAYPGLDQLVTADGRHCGTTASTAGAAMQSALEPWSTAETVAAGATTSTTLNYAHKVPYPNNLLRNIGRRYARTEYSFVVDIDLLPSASLYEHFLEFGRRTHLFREWDAALLPEAPADASQRNKVVFVVPTYEIDLSGQWTASGSSNAVENSHQSLSNNNNRSSHQQMMSGQFKAEHLQPHFPQNKAELIVGIEQRLIRPFYIELCWKCQKWTDYEAWLHASSLINTSEHRVDILFEVFWHDPWEPFYISANSVPMYDERFRQYGFNRISQVRRENSLRVHFVNTTDPILS